MMTTKPRKELIKRAEHRACNIDIVRFCHDIDDFVLVDDTPLDHCCEELPEDRL